MITKEANSAVLLITAFMGFLRSFIRTSFTAPADVGSEHVKQRAESERACGFALLPQRVDCFR